MDCYDTGKFSLTASCLLSCFVSSAVLAADDYLDELDSFLGEMPTVLTVTRLPQSMQELPTAVTVIDRQMIDASGAVELTELFRLVAGFQVGHYHDVDGSRTVVTYHGNTNQYASRMQVLIDGRSVYTWATGGAEWTDMPISIDDVERIEVSRGPNGVTYGSNAFLGVINIITRYASEQQGQHLRMSLDDDAYREAVVRHAEVRDDFSYRITARVKEDDGFEPYLKSNGTLYELNDDNKSTSMTLRVDYRGGVNDYWTFQAGGAAGERALGDHTDVLNPLRTRDMVTHYQQVQWKHLFSSESEVNFQFYHHLHDIEDIFTTVPLPIEPFDVDFSARSERYDMELSHRFSPTDSTRLVWGGEFWQDKVIGGNFYGQTPHHENKTTRLFTNLEWQPGNRWVINMGDMMEQSDISGRLHSPRLAINRLVGDAGYIRASVGRAYRSATAIERFADFTLQTASGSLLLDLYDHDPNMLPEKIESSELSFGTDSRNFRYEIKLFREDIESEIDAVSDESWPYSHYIIMNVGNTRNEGGELQLLARSEDAIVSVAYSHVRTRGRRLTEINPELWIDSEVSVPRHTISALLSTRISSGLWADINYYAASSMKYFAGDTLDPISTADFSIRKTFAYGKSTGEFKLIFKNILGSYADFEDETISERKAFASLSMSL